MQITETGNYEELIPLFTSSGLEMHLDGNKPPHMITCWRVSDESGEILGGISIEAQDGFYKIGDIAVKKELRATGIGSMMMEHAMKRLRDLGANEVYLTAKAPKFFEKLGFTYITSEETPDIFNCKTCVQRGTDCFPEFMKYEYK